MRAWQGKKACKITNDFLLQMDIITGTKVHGRDINATANQIVGGVCSDEDGRGSLVDIDSKGRFLQCRWQIDDG